MGIIRKQSIFSSIFIYVGFFIGAINILFLFPNYFTPEEFGLTRVLIDVSLLFATLCTVGSVPVTLKFFPFYNSYLQKKENDLPLITLILCVSGIILFLVFTFIFKDWMIKKFGERSPLFVTYFNLIFPLTISYTFFMLFESYAWTLRQTVISNFSKEVLFRVVTTVLIVFYISGLFSLDVFLNLYSLIYVPSVVVLLILVIRKKALHLTFNFSKVTRRLFSKILSYTLLLFSGSVLNVVSRTVDTIIIASQSPGGLKDAAIFIIPTYLVTIMDVPQRSIISIATPIISEAWKERNIDKIREIYQKTSLNLLIIGLALGGVIYLNMHNAITLLGDTYAPIKSIALILGIAKLIDLGAGVNSTILLLSKYWRIDFITNMCFVALAIPLNYFLIKRFGVLGAAYANFIALTFFNLLRLIFIYKLFHLQPFSWRTVITLLTGFFFILAVEWFLPALKNIYIDVVIRSFLYLTAFVFIILKFRISSDLNDLFRIFLNKLYRSK